MDKIMVDTSKGNSSQAWMTLTAFLLHVARYPVTADGLVCVSVDWWQHVECQYTTPAQAEAAAALTEFDDAVIRGSVLWLGKPQMTVSLRGKVNDLLTFGRDEDGAWKWLKGVAYPAGVLLMAVDEHEVGIVRDIGVRLPAVWQRFGRVAENLPGSVRLTWLAKAATA